MTWKTPLFSEISDVIGDSAARSLVHVYPGAQVYVPVHTNLDARHPIASLLGLDIAKRFALRFGGRVVKIPTAAAINVAARNAQIVALYRTGKSTRSIAIQYQLGERYVRNLIARDSDG